MMDISKLNDPEYRWQHKYELARAYPNIHHRKLLGIKTLDYSTLRHELAITIREEIIREIDWNKLQHLVNLVPPGCIRSLKKKEQLTPADRYHFELRDRGKCFICGSTHGYGSNNPYISNSRSGTTKMSHLHHIIPNGEVTDKNITTLCGGCHQLVHMALYVAGKWRYAHPI